MLEEEKICPFPGLRPFLEDESIFFKGRDEHIKKSALLLEERKFLMITGASGDGKSSIVYAGLLPFARAGFIQSEYANWAIADFRPERTPLENLCSSLASIIPNSQASTIRSAIDKGFSSLVDLYKNSSLHLDKTDLEWLELDDKSKVKAKRSAANLLIIVDQFEEFYTNSENYNSGVPSNDSALVVSTLLETARLSAKDNLPIYIVFTMRSDYIGQCSSFRGLPEFIGFSQFFVPRLKRVDLKRAVVEPAQLSGVEISNRLVERLIYDLTDGVDQLPILQHALNRIWNIAVARDEALDLLHYAMAGGMDATELAPEDKLIFDELKKQGKVSRVKSVGSLGLKNVLDGHAREVYQQAVKSSNLSRTQARDVIEIAFKSLTRIDDERAVRNRMTVQEISQIINDPTVSSKDVSDVLQVFRLQGNTFLKPYVNEDDPESLRLSPDSVLDITHESLIRNWKSLSDWANEEHRHYTTYTELSTQLNHWVANDRNKSFLLSSGSLNYFEEWQNNVTLNKDWIGRYQKVASVSNGQANPVEILTNINQYIKKSIRKHFIPRAFTRYGVLNIIAAIGTLLLVLTSSYFLISSRGKQNADAINKVKEEGIALLNTNKGRDIETSLFLVTLGRTDPDKFWEFVNSRQGVEAKMRILNIILSNIVFFDPGSEADLTKDILHEAISLISSEVSNPENDPQFLLESTNRLISKSIALFIFSNNPVYRESEIELSKLGLDLVMNNFTVQELQKFNQQHVTAAIRYGLSNGVLIPEMARSTISTISPFEQSISNDSLTIDYTSLILLYASVNNIDRSIQSLDSLNARRLLRGEGAVTTAMTRSGFLILDKYGPARFEEYCKKGASSIDVSISRYYEILVHNMIGREHGFVFGTQRENYQNFQLSLSSFTEAEIETIFSLLEQELLLIDDANEKHFELAELYKTKGILLSKYNRVTKSSIKASTLDQLFEKSIEYVNRVDSAYLAKPFKFNFYRDNNAINNFPLTKSQAYLYPDFIFEDMPRSYSRHYSSAFFEFLVNSDRAKQLYNSEQTNFSLTLWVHNTCWRLVTINSGNIYPWGIDTDGLHKVSTFYNTFDDDDFNRKASELAKLTSAFYTRDKTIRHELLASIDFPELVEEYDARTTYEMYMSNMMGELVNLNSFEQYQTLFEEGVDPFETSGRLIIDLHSLDRVYDMENPKLFFDYLNSSHDLLAQYALKPTLAYGIGSIEYSSVPGLVSISSIDIENKIASITRDADEMNQGRNFKISSTRFKVIRLAQQEKYFEAYKAVSQDASINNKLVTYRYILDEQIKKKIGPTLLDWEVYDRNFKTSQFVREEF